MVCGVWGKKNNFSSFQYRDLGVAVSVVHKEKHLTVLGRHLLVEFQLPGIENASCHPGILDGFIRYGNVFPMAEALVSFCFPNHEETFLLSA